VGSRSTLVFLPIRRVLDGFSMLHPVYPAGFVPPCLPTHLRPEGATPLGRDVFVALVKPSFNEQDG
jgi:hypothetical protein